MKLLVTAGPTREYLDPFRFLSNPSSGRMGYAVAASSVARGWETVLVSGPVSLPPVEGAVTVPVESALRMREEVLRRFEACDALVMAAAVSDYRPRSFSALKIKKTGAGLNLALEPNPDILAEAAARKGKRIVVGFAAETDNLVDYAREKLKNKKLDFIVANDISRPGSGFGTPASRAVAVFPGGRAEDWGFLPKTALAEKILNLVLELRESG